MYVIANVTVERDTVGIRYCIAIHKFSAFSFSHFADYLPIGEYESWDQELSSGSTCSVICQLEQDIFHCKLTLKDTLNWKKFMNSKILRVNFFIYL